MRKIVAVLLAALMPTFAVAQSANQFPSTMPSGTVYGRLAIGAGPGQPVPITSLLSAAQQSAANKVLAGPTSGGTGAMTARSLLYADFPSMAAGTLLGNPGSAPAVPQAFTIQNLPNLTAPNATLDFLPIYDHTTGQIKYSSPSQLPGTASPLAQNNIWSGTNDFQSDSRFGGSPWFDVKSAGHGCAAAIGNGVADDTSAIQCHINYMNTTYSGGIVFVPPGTYIVSGGGIVISAGVWLEGSSPNASIIEVTTDSIAVSFSISGGTCPSGGHLGGMEKLWVIGYQVNTSAQPSTKIGTNCSVTIRDTRLWFGAQGLFNNGADSLIENSFICGWQQCVFSQGANWYVRDKLDSIGITMTGTSAAFMQGTYVGPGGATAIAENHFTQTDFSGSFTYSVYIDDSNNVSAITHIDGGVFSSQVFLNHHKFTMITGTEIGSTTFANNAGTLLMSSSPAFASTTISGAGGKVCATNSNSNFTNC